MPEHTRVRAERIEVRRSREQILDAAERHYETRDGDPTMSELAISAGVGNATLYRRFPTIDDVIRALFERHTAYQQAVADEVLAQPTGWDSVVALINGLALMVLDHPSIPRVTRRMIRLEPDLLYGSQWDAALKDLTRRAQDEGMLRPDVESNDLTLAAFRMSEYSLLPSFARSRVVARQVVLLLDGLRATSASAVLPGDGITTEEIQRIYRHPVDPRRNR